MPNEVKLTWSLERDSTKIYVSDDTGVFDPVKNEGGYGAPNQERNSFAFVLYVLRRPTKVVPELIGVSSFKYRDGFLGVDYSSTYTNTHVSRVTVPTLKDGVYDLNAILVPTANSESTNSIRYNTTTNTLERFTGGAWQELTNYSLLLDTTKLPLQANCSEIILGRTEAYRARLYINYLNTKGTDKESKFFTKYLEIGAKMHGAFLAHRRDNNKVMAQEILEGMTNESNNM